MFACPRPGAGWSVACPPYPRRTLICLPSPQRYQALVQTGAIEADAAQKQVVARLGQAGVRALGERSLARKEQGARMAVRQPRPPSPVKGLYIWGSVGRGKTMLMDLFFETAPGRRRSGGPISTPSWRTFMSASHAYRQR